MVEYLQRALGYSMTGTTEEKAVFVPFGTGNNGKTTLLSTFLQLLEEYAVLLQVDTLMVRAESNNTQADLADLRGARFVMTSETEEGQRLAQGKLKRITQGMGKIKATRKYENPIEFPETHKLWMDTNSKPLIRAADDQATFNRLHPIPFTVTIPTGEIDKTLPRKLLAEAEGILAWAVEGAKLWRRVGLQKPPEVSAANDDWRSENDQLGRFVEECCVVADCASAKARPLYDAYRVWAEGAGEHAVTETLFGTRLRDRGYAKEHRRYGTVYSGIGLRASNDGGGARM
jgi:putative DNA primase/helicase